jgi:hypothetical protein
MRTLAEDIANSAAGVGKSDSVPRDHGYDFVRLPLIFYDPVDPMVAFDRPARAISAVQAPMARPTATHLTPECILMGVVDG